MDGGASKGSDRDPCPAVVTRLALPEVEARIAELDVAGSWPAAAALGEPFTLRLRLRNRGAALREVALRLTDAPGYVFAGAEAPAYAAVLNCRRLICMYDCGMCGKACSVCK